MGTKKDKEKQIRAMVNKNLTSFVSRKIVKRKIFQKSKKLCLTPTQERILVQDGDAVIYLQHQNRNRFTLKDRGYENPDQFS